MLGAVVLGGTSTIVGCSATTAGMVVEEGLGSSPMLGSAIGGGVGYADSRAPGLTLGLLLLLVLVALLATGAIGV